MVSTQAQTMLPATPQRTFDALRTGADADDGPGDGVRRRHWDALPGGQEQRVSAPPVSGAEAPTGLLRCDFGPWS